MSGLRDNIQVVLVDTRFPENIGMVARACGNMGVSRLALVRPELWGGEYEEKALTLATSAGRPVLQGARVCSGLGEALAPSTLSFGTTARTGGWRQGILYPSQSAELALAHLENGGAVSFVFGPEDKGLSNEAIERCSHLVNIPTASEPSLNLAQAALVLLYELTRAIPTGAEDKPPRPGKIKSSPLITHEQGELLMERIQEAMQALESLPADNSGYFLLPVRRLVSRMELRHNEFSILMGICSKILRLKGILDQSCK